MRTTVIAVLLNATMAVASSLTAQPAEQPWTLEEIRSEKGGRELVFTLELPETPEVVFRRWTETDEARRFLGREVRIEPRVGGRFEVLFDPVNDPAGALAGTYGSRVVSLEAPRQLVFEWNSLTPRVAAREVGGRRVLQKSLVEVRIESVPEAPSSSRVHVRHYGMGNGPDWDASYRYYRDSGWPWILRRLTALYRTSERVSR